jgi:hypothetical protein
MSDGEPTLAELAARLDGLRDSAGSRLAALEAHRGGDQITANPWSISASGQAEQSLPPGVVSASHKINEAAGNVALGSTLPALTTGKENTALGQNAANALTTGSQNNALGVNALLHNTEGEKNTAIGTNALAENTTGSKNVAIGNTALYANTTGQENVAVGNTSLRNNTTGTRNTAVGQEALDENTTGNKNTAVGIGALNENKTGSENTAVGTNCLPGGEGAKGNLGSRNTAIGYKAGQKNEGEGNIFIGWEAGAAETGNNKLYIHNGPSATPLIKGDFTAKTVTVTGRLEPGEAAAKPAKPEGEAVTHGEVSTARVRCASIIGNGAKTKWKFEHKLNTRLIAVSVQSATAEEGEEIQGATVVKVVAVGAGNVEVTFAAAPANGAQYFITVIG